MATQQVATQGPRSTERAAISEKTLRTDRWWIDPLITFIVFSGFVIYATWSAFNHPLVFGNGAPHREFFAKPYLSPFYSPCFADGCPSEVSWGAVDIWHWLSPALYVLIFPLSFRATCYYYRRAYYRAFWRAPAACAVREPHATYSGETRFPLIMQNLHRYFFFMVLLISILNTYDLTQAFRGPDGNFGLGLGTIIMLVNVVMLWAYTLSCHSCRHITGGRLKNFSKHPARYWAWTQISKLNTRHMQLAWITLGTLALTDLYIWLLAAGVFSDPRIFN
jgi:hypothetical protein